MKSGIGIHVLPQVLLPKQIAYLLQLETSANHHDDSHGHGNNHGVRQEKSLHLPEIALSIWSGLPSLRAEYLVPHSVDPKMKLYRLGANAGIVPPHQDTDFYGPDGSVARYSILVYLNDDYIGGGTRFACGNTPTVGVGGGLIFRHNLVHEGLAVKNGVKYVLKTDLFVK